MALVMACKCPFTGKSKVLSCNLTSEYSGHLANLDSLVQVFGSGFGFVFFFSWNIIKVLTEIFYSLELDLRQYLV